MEEQEKESLKNQIIKRYGILLKKSDVCNLLRCSSASLSRKLARSEINYIKSNQPNAPVTFTVDAVIDYIARNTVKHYGGY